MGTTQSIHQEKAKVVLAETAYKMTKEQDLFGQREFRAIEAEALLALVKRIIEPLDSGEVDNDILSQMNSQERYGLSFVLDIVAKSMEENHTAICSCHERKQCCG